MCGAMKNIIGKSVGAQLDCSVEKPSLNSAMNIWGKKTQTLLSKDTA